MYKRAFGCIAVLFLSLGSALGQPQNLVVYPLTSQDVLLGVALSDQIATAFEDQLEVIGPAEAPGLVPPVVVEGGFINPVAFLQGRASLDSPFGAALIQGALGADASLTGQVEMGASELSLSLYLAYDNELRELRVNAPEDEPGLLANKAVALLARQLELTRPALDREVDLSGPYDAYVRALTLLSSGFVEEARQLLDRALEETPDEALEHLLSDVEAVLLGQTAKDTGLAASLSLNQEPTDEALVRSYFAAFAEETSLPVPVVWDAVLAIDLDEDPAAAFDEAAEAYPYGLGVRASYRAANDVAGAAEDIESVQTGGDAAALLAGALAANILEDTELEKATLNRLAEVAPSLSYPYERLSFIAFDEEEPLAAVSALRIATRLDPGSDLYWTNLGWAYYLAGNLEESETASVRAIELDDGQFIARYNLGLVRTVTNRLEQAIETYDGALRLDPDVDDEAIRDLENARDLYPDEASVHYALAYLYEAEGRRAEAAEQYRQYLERSETGAFIDRAARRANILSAPPPPIDILPEVQLGLGPDLLQMPSYQPGDRLFSTFELVTPGSELPQQVAVVAELKDASGEVLVSESRDVIIPEDAIGYVVRDVAVILPDTLEPGTYALELAANADAERTAQLRLELSVAGEPGLLRQLLSRSVIMQDVETGQLLYASSDLDRPDDVLISSLLEELRTTAGLAEEALPEIESGRFEGLNGGEVFRQSSEQDVRDFLDFLLASGAQDTSFSFVDAYAQWAIDGAAAEN